MRMIVNEGYISLSRRWTRQLFSVLSQRGRSVLSSLQWYERVGAVVRQVLPSMIMRIFVVTIMAIAMAMAVPVIMILIVIMGSHSRIGKIRTRSRMAERGSRVRMGMEVIDRAVMAMAMR